MNPQSSWSYGGNGFVLELEALLLHVERLRELGGDKESPNSELRRTNALRESSVSILLRTRLDVRR